MTFKDVPASTSIFLDSNILVYHFGAEPMLGPACKGLLGRIERQEIQGFVSAAVLSDLAHKLMCDEARTLFAWSQQGITRQLRRHPNELVRLTRYRDAIDEIPRLNIHVLNVNYRLVSQAAALSQQHGLLSGDALIVAVMRDQGINHLASNDADFDRVPGMTRYAPA